MREKLNILEMCTSPSWGGMEMRVLKTARELKENGHKVVILCTPDSTLFEYAEKETLTSKLLPFKGGLHFNLILKLRKFIKDNNFDVIHCQYSRDLRFVIPAIEGIRPKIPVVFTKRLGSYIKKKDLIHKYLFSRVDLVTTISSVIKQNVIDTCPVDPQKVEILYNGIDSNIYQKALSCREEIRLKENVGQETVVGIIGRISPGKGHEEFIKAAEIILQKEKNVQFWLIGNASYGEDKYADQVLDAAKKLTNNNGLKLLGFREDIPEVLSALDILAVPSHAEAFGNVAIEGMAAGKPIVASGSDGLLDIVDDNITGLQIPPKNAQALANALMKLINNPEDGIKMGQAGLEKVIDKFDSIKQYKKLEEKFYSLSRK